MRNREQVPIQGSGKAISRNATKSCHPNVAFSVPITANSRTIGNNSVYPILDQFRQSAIKPDLYDHTNRNVGNYLITNDSSIEREAT